MPDTPEPLLAADEPAAARVINPDAESPLLLVCEHASDRLPALLRPAYPLPLMRTHYGSDIGTDALVEQLAARLGATAVAANYSRIVIDCNRRLDDPTLILPVADGVVVAANAGLDEVARQMRIESIYAPFHAAVDRELQRIVARGQVPRYVAIHSFTPQLAGVTRPWDAGLMWDTDSRMTEHMLAVLRAEPGLNVGSNEPYSGKHVADFSVDYHAEQNGYPNAAIEIRQDHLTTAAGIERWAERIAGALSASLEDPRLGERAPPAARVFAREAAYFARAG